MLYFTNALFYPLTLVREHLKIVPSYSAIQIRKNQEILEHYLKKEVITNVFAKAGLRKAHSVGSFIRLHKAHSATGSQIWNKTFQVDRSKRLYI